MESEKLADIEDALRKWAAWHHSGGANLGYPRRSVVLRSGWRQSTTVLDDMCEEADTQAAQIVEAIVNDLPYLQRGAVWNRWLGCRIFILHPESELDKAYERLYPLMFQRGVF